MLGHYNHPNTDLSVILNKEASETVGTFNLNTKASLLSYLTRQYYLNKLTSLHMKSVTIIIVAFSPTLLGDAGNYLNRKTSINS